MNQDTITPPSYHERRITYDAAFDNAGGEGNYCPPARTTEEIANREIDSEEHIAIELLRQAPSAEITPLSTLVRNVVSDPFYVDDLATAHATSAALAAIRDGEFVPASEWTRLRRVQANIEMARAVLALAVIQHRRYGFAGSRHSTPLGFGLTIDSSLAAEVVIFVRRIVEERRAELLASIAENEEAKL